MTTTTLVFLKYPEPGRVKTRLARAVGEATAARMYRAMAEHLVGKLTDPVVCYDPDWPLEAYRDWLGERPYRAQEGRDLGERIAGALEKATPSRGHRAVLVGTDSPQLDQATIDRALAALDESQAVLGPCYDGGYYLIGVRDRVPDLFTGIPWSTERVLELTLARARRENVSVGLLEKEYDVDSYDDLQRALKDPRVTITV